MRKSVLQLYAPFLALVLVQPLVITAAPSTGPGDHDIARTRRARREPA
jgi:hypothetical protein